MRFSSRKSAAVRDPALEAEAFWFQDLSRPFPAHFHPYYVIGLVDRGARQLVCRGRELPLEAGDLLIFQPGDAHSCACGAAPLAYRSVSLEPERLRRALSAGGPPQLPAPVIRSPEAARALGSLHHLLWTRAEPLAKETALLALLECLLARPAESRASCRREVETVCAYIHAHYAEHMGLEELAGQAGLSGSALLRAFVKAKGITPYRYLEAVRVSKAKGLLAAGVSPAEAALRTGFSDQSHFTNQFTRLMGLPPGVYQSS